ncbi:hypothetical protein Tco_1371543 [Tanacetum coccineum]
MSLSLAENVIGAGANNRPPMLDKTMYSSWASRMLLYIRGKENGKLLVDLVLNGPFKYGTFTVLGTQTTPAIVRERTYDKLTYAEKIHESCEIKAINIVLQGLPQDIYNMVNHHTEDKDIWDRLKLLIEGSEISLQDREYKLYNEFNMFTSPEWSKFVTDVKLAKDLHNTNFDHLYGYMRKHESHADEVRLTRQRFSDPIALQAYQPQDVHLSSVVHHQSYQPPPHQQRQASFPQLDSGFVVPSFLPSNNPIASLNKAMDFINTGRQNHGYAGSGARSNATAIECIKPKGLRNSTWLKEKAMLAEALESRMEIPTLAAFQTNDLDALDSDCNEAPSASVVLMAKLSLYDSATLSEVPTHDNYLYNHVIDHTVQRIQYSEQPVFNNDTYIDNDITSENTSSSAQHESMIMCVIEEMSNQVGKCTAVDKENKMINESLTAELERYKEQIKLFEERQQFDLNDRENYIHGQLRKVIVDKNAKVTDFENRIHSLKQQLNKTVESHKTLSTTVDILKMESKAKEDKYLDKIIDLEKKNKALDNVIYKMGRSTQTMHMLTKPQAFYDECHKIVLETLELAKVSRLKMHAKQNDPIMQEKKVNIAPIDYVALNKLSDHFVKHFVPQKQLFAEQAFWLPISKPVSEIPPVQSEPVLKEIPHELPTISLVKDSFNKMRSHVHDFENVVTIRTKVTGKNEGSWGFEHIQKAFDKDVKPFVKTLEEYFHMFNQGLHKEISDMKEVFTQMDTEVAKCSVERKIFEIKEKELLLENDRLLELLISQDLVHTTVNSLAKMIDYQSMEKSFLDEYSECVELKAELSKKNDMVEKDVYVELSK